MHLLTRRALTWGWLLHRAASKHGAGTRWHTRERMWGWLAGCTEQAVGTMYGSRSDGDWLMQWHRRTGLRLMGGDLFQTLSLLLPSAIFLELDVSHLLGLALAFAFSG